MFKTGDLGKWSDDGEITFAGRIDFQVKIRGLRIELSEIESTIKEIKDISYVVVIDRIRKDSSEKYLVGYYITPKNITAKDIRNYLENKLPDYMIPQYFVKINSIPFNINGKLDRRALPEPNIDDMLTSEYVAPETTIEKKLCDIYSKVFKIDVKKIGKNLNFFDVGGDSLLAVKV
ncbi:acetyl-CoA synthetase-like protein, partial [Anaeromyces robustus]